MFPAPYGVGNSFFKFLSIIMKSSDKFRNLTVLGNETNFDGLLRFSDDLHIEGKFSGAVDAKGFLRIARGAVCNVQYIKAASIVVEGTVHGPINAVGDVELKPYAVVVGDIVANRLKIADNVSFDGVIHMVSNMQGVSEDIFASDVEQFRQELVKE